MILCLISLFYLFLFLFNCCVNDLIFRREKRRKVNPPKEKKKISN